MERISFWTNFTFSLCTIMMENSNDEITLCIKWSKFYYNISLPRTASILDLKLQLQNETMVSPSRQKLMGLKVNGRQAKDDDYLSDIVFKPNSTILMIGTQESELLKELEDDPMVVNDLHLTIDNVIDIDPKDLEENHRKIENRVKNYKFNLLNEPRKGKKLLVLDIDYTIFDHRSTAENAQELMRPYLHEFLTEVYPHYDIMIWSATSMKWIELKMKELGVATNENYKITAYVDYGAMITLNSSKYGVFNAKPLKVIWERFKEYYGPENTIMFDDLRRNFIMNPQNGLRIKAFRNGPAMQQYDKELLKLKKYLLSISSLPHFNELDHSKWKLHLKQKKE